MTSDTIKIYANPLLTGNAMVDSATCGNNTGAVNGLVVSGGTPRYSYQWINTSIGATVGNQPNLINIGAGTYSLVIMDAHECKAVSHTSYTVLATAGVEAAFISSTLLGETPVTVSFSNTSTGAVNYLWNFRDGSAISIRQNPSYTYNTMGTYTVVLIAGNTAGCTDTAFAVIQVNENTQIIIPNVFSPNGDGVNDGFFISTKGITAL